MALMGALYYFVPLVSGKSLSWPRLVRWVFWIETILIPITAVLMIIGGIKGGRASQDGLVDDALDKVLSPYMIPVGILRIICALVAIMFAVQIIHTGTKKAAG